MPTTSNKSVFRSCFCREKANDCILFGIVLLGLVGAVMAAERKMMGGLSNVKSFNDLELGAEDRAKIEGFLKDVQPEAEAKAGRKFSSLEPVSFATQLVNGINYFIKASTGDGKFVHLRLYKPFKESEPVQFVGLQDEKTKEDALAYF